MERVKRDLSRYAAGYEAGRIESMNKDQVQIMEEKVRLMKELQRELEEQPINHYKVANSHGSLHYLLGSHHHDCRERSRENEALSEVE